MDYLWALVDDTAFCTLSPPPTYLYCPFVQVLTMARFHGSYRYWPCLDVKWEGCYFCNAPPPPFYGWFLYAPLAASPLIFHYFPIPRATRLSPIPLLVSLVSVLVGSDFLSATPASLGRFPCWRWGHLEHGNLVQDLPKCLFYHLLVQWPTMQFSCVACPSRSSPSWPEYAKTKLQSEYTK